MIQHILPDLILLAVEALVLGVLVTVLVHVFKEGGHRR